MTTPLTTVLKSSVVLLALAATACMGLPPLRMQATPADYERLAGKWRGEYASTALGRNGTIDFELIAGTNKASGAVVMTPHGSTRSYGGHETPGYEMHANDSSQLLTISFVRAEGGTISGWLDRYWDPDRSCFAHTVFRGVLEDRTIAGTFKTTWDCGAGEASGEWKAARLK